MSLNNKTRMNHAFRTSILLLALSLFVITGSFFWPKLWQSFRERYALAQIINVKGQVQKFSFLKSDSQTISKGQGIQALEGLIIGKKSEATLKFFEGAEIKLPAGALVSFSGRTTNPQINIKKGNLEIIRINSKDKLWINQQGKNIRAQDYQAKLTPDQTLEINPDLQTLGAESPVMGLEGAVNSTTTTTAGTEAENTPAADQNNLKAAAEERKTELRQSEQGQIRLMISDRIARQKTRIYRCYSQLLQKEPEASGRMSVHFTVNKLGKVEDAELVSSQFKEESFHKCILQVLQRTDFLPFEGSTMATLLPLKFEKN